MPTVVSRAWAVSVLLGGLVVALGPVHRLPPAGLTPATVADYLARAVGPAARDVRVNGVYGSGRDGAWQFVAHLTWRTASDVVTGGVLTLPQQAGGQAGDSPVSTDALVAEEARGWTLAQLRRDAAALTAVDAAAALLELEIPTSDDGTMTFCAADGAGLTATGAGPATCSARRRSGPARTFPARIEVQADAGALSVRLTGS